MKTTTLFLAAGLAAQLSAQVLLPGDSATLLPESPDTIASGLGSVGWLHDPSKNVQWLQIEGPTAFAYLVRDTTGIVVSPIDDFVLPIGTGTSWQESGNFPEEVWLRVYLSNDPLVPGDPIGTYAVRSVRFGFDRPGVGPFEIPEARHLDLLAAVGLLGFASYRRFWS